MSTLGLVLVGALVVAPGLARADVVVRVDETFEDYARGAHTLTSVEELVWTMTATCTAGDEVQQRQCRLTRDARAKTLLSSTLLVEAEPDAFAVASWNPATKSMPVRLSACIRCTPMQIDGKPWHVTGAAPRVDSGKVRTAELHDGSREFPTDAAAKSWIKALENARIQMVIKITDRKPWVIAGKTGIGVDVIAHRVVTPCNGNVIVSAPPSGKVEPDRKACPAPAPKSPAN